MRYGFYQLHRDLFEDEEIGRLRDACVAVFPRYAENNKLSMATVFHNRAEDPESFTQLEEVLKWFWTSPFPGIFHAIHKEVPALMIDLLSVRYHQRDSSASHVGWHADANFMTASGPMMVCWVPLDSVGETAPGLEFCLPRQKADRETLHLGWRDVIRKADKGMIWDEDLPKLYGIGNYRTEASVLEPGDCYIFDRYTVHRTQRLETVTTDRYAIEFRIASRRIPARRVSLDEDLMMSVFNPATNRIDIMSAPQLYGVS